MQELVNQLFLVTEETERVVGFSASATKEGLKVEDLKVEGPFYELNTAVSLAFSDDKEAARFLVEVIRFWHTKRGLFCHDYTQGCQNTELSEDEWSFEYKTPSTHGGCVSGQKILDKIFGSRERFNSLPFVTYHGDRVYTFPFDLLKHFAENGHESTVRVIEERKQKAEQKKKEEAEARERKHREENPSPTTTEGILKAKAEAFRKSWNKETHDWIFAESELLVEELLFVAYCREYHVNTDENAYSMVYVFSKNAEHGNRIYYTKFWESRPEWRDAKQFIKTLVSATRKGNKLEISAKAEDGTPMKFTYSIT